MRVDGGIHAVPLEGLELKSLFFVASDLIEKARKINDLVSM
jgi:hypothetical protein